MLAWAISFFVVALVAAISGFTAAPEDIVIAHIARVLFVIFLLLTVTSLLAHLNRR